MLKYRKMIIKLAYLICIKNVFEFYFAYMNKFKWFQWWTMTNQSLWKILVGCVKTTFCSFNICSLEESIKFCDVYTRHLSDTKNKLINFAILITWLILSFFFLGWIQWISFGKLIFSGKVFKFIFKDLMRSVVIWWN